jgi:uroporphyrinogen-III synthase
VAEEMRYKIPDSLKYFCQSEAVAFTCRSTWYIERENLCRETNLPELIPLIKSIRMKLSVPSTDKLKDLVPDELDNLGIKWKIATFFKTVISDLSDLADVKYDVLVFFQPQRY